VTRKKEQRRPEQGQVKDKEEGAEGVGEAKFGQTK